MKTMLEFLDELKEHAAENLYNCSANYAMTKPQPGQEQLFTDAVHERNLIDQLIELVESHERNASRSESILDEVLRCIETELDAAYNSDSAHQTKEIVPPMLDESEQEALIESASNQFLQSLPSSEELMHTLRMAREKRQQKKV